MLRVNGGPANSGTRVVKEHPRWQCECNDMPRHNGFHGTHSNGVSLARWNPGERYACPDCGTRRP